MSKYISTPEDVDRFFEIDPCFVPNSGKIDYASFEEAKRYAQDNNIRSRKEWSEYCAYYDKPENIPSCPDLVYRNKGWTNWYDFLGKENPHKKVPIVSLEEAGKYAQSHNIRSSKEWYKHCKSGEKPDNIPTHVDTEYRNKGWTNWYDFLGKENPHKKVPFVSLEETKRYARLKNIKSQTEWYKHCKSGEKPNNIPTYPAEVYKNKGWTNWYDFLGKKNPWETPRTPIASIWEAKEYARFNYINSQTEWYEHCKSGEKPANIPTDVASAYQFSGWIDWYDFLGKKNPSIPTLVKVRVLR